MFVTIFRRETVTKLRLSERFSKFKWENPSESNLDDMSEY